MRQLSFDGVCIDGDSVVRKATTHIARKAALIGIEDLNVAGMLKKRTLARAVSDASLWEFHRQLRYKAAWYGGRVRAIDRFYPSSELHNGCGGYKQDLDLGFNPVRLENVQRTHVRFTLT